MIPADRAITQVRRALTQSAILRWALIGVVAGAILVEPLLASSSDSAVTVLLAAAGVWLVLSFISVRGSRLAADSSSLIATGQYDRAERHIADALNSFSIFRMAKLMSLHHLAVLRHAQSRWQDSAMLCRALLTHRLGDSSGLNRSSRLILAESLLELGDLRGTYENLASLYSQRLTLREALNLLAVQTDYLSRIGAWDAMLAQVKTRVELAELMPTLPSARTQAFLALAARKKVRHDWADWLRRRVELLVDVQKLCTDRPMLWDVWRS
jgi:hypothetical protein